MYLVISNFTFSTQERRRGRFLDGSRCSAHKHLLPGKKEWNVHINSSNFLDDVPHI
uniref:Uncharacterized protein n=1 Tax=Arundo donax TaxID=35708 RepID=A0A0A9E8B9_ARUDO